MTYLTNPEPKPDGCIFCNALATADNGHKTLILHRGAHCFVILNLYPYNNGHLMIVPLEHIESIETMSIESVTEMMTLSQHCIGVLRKAYSPHAFNIGINIGAAAGAGVPGHIHLHIVPRWSGDTNFMPVISNTRIIPEMIDETYKRLRELW